MYQEDLDNGYRQQQPRSSRRQLPGARPVNAGGHARPTRGPFCSHSHGQLCGIRHPNKPADHFPLNLSSFNVSLNPFPAIRCPTFRLGGQRLEATPLGEVEVKARKQELFQSLQRLQSQPIGVGSEAEFKKLYGLAQQLMGHPQAFSSKQELDDLALVVRLGAHKTLVSVPQRAGETAQYYSLSQGLGSSAAPPRSIPTRSAEMRLCWRSRKTCPRDNRQTYLLTSGGPGLEAPRGQAGWRGRGDGGFGYALMVR